MSIKMIPGSARLTVLGSGWSNSPVESGNGLTNEGNLFEQIGGILGYDPGPNVNWDDIGGGNVDWEGVLYEGENGTIYTDPNGTGVWTNPDTGEEYPGNGSTLVSKELLTNVSIVLEQTAANDAKYGKNSIPDSILRTLYSGPVSGEGIVVSEGPDRPHKYSPPVYYIQTGPTTAMLFLDEPFYHSTADGDEITVSKNNVSIRDGSKKVVYYSSCTTILSETWMSDEYNTYSVEQICWQCLHGSFEKVLLLSKPNTITSEMIQTGNVTYETMTYNGKTYYKLLR